MPQFLVFKYPSYGAYNICLENISLTLDLKELFRFLKNSHFQNALSLTLKQRLVAIRKKLIWHCYFLR